MPRDDDLTGWVEFTDFSPGIFSNNNLAGGVNVTSDNPCKAQESGTYRCISLPTGGLGPLPRRVESSGLTTDPTSSNLDPILVAGLGTWGRVFPNPSGDTDNASRFEIHLALYWEEDSGGGEVDIFLYWLRERTFDVNKGTETILANTVTNVSPVGGLGDRPRYSQFHKTRMNPTTPDSPGTPVMVGVGSTTRDQIGYSKAFPNPATPTTTSTLAVGTNGDPYVISVAHQGRVVLALHDNYDHGLNSDLSANESILYTATNDNTLSSATPAVFVPEVDALITDMASMSANQLFVIKCYGGGYVLQGDLDDVTVLRLPNLMCADGAPTIRGCNTAKGFVYSAGYNGLYLWNGGDQATQISQQLDGEAFIANQGTLNRGHGGQCDRWMNYVVAPRNWIWQTEDNRQGWWRLENPDDLLIRMWSTTSDFSRMVGVESSFEPDDLFIHQFDYNDLAYTYSWLSHPLWISQARRMEVRKGIVALQGHGTVTVTVRGELGQISEHPFTIAHDNIRNYRWDVALDAENLTVQIEASGDVGAGPGTAEAPLLHRMFLGYRAGQHLRNANA